MMGFSGHLAELFSQSQHAEQSAPVGRESQTPQKSALPLVVPNNHPAIAGHFPGNPIVPGVVILSHVTNAIRQQLPDIVLGTLLSMRFYAPLRPDRSFHVRAELRNGGRTENARVRVYVEVREDDALSVPGTLIAAGQWDCGAGMDTDEGA